jgi:hypothetical protein
MRIFTGFKKVFHQVLYPVILTSCLLTVGCNMKVKYLPQIEAPYLAELEFLEQVSHAHGKTRKKVFKNNMIRPDFYIFLKINNIENQGKVVLRFYQSRTRHFYEGMNEIRNWLKMMLVGLNTTLPFPILFTGTGAKANTGRYDWKTGGMLVPVMGRDLFILLSRSYLSPQLFNALHIRHQYFAQARKLDFSFGEADKYFEYIIFIDRVENLKPGKYRYAVFFNDHLMYENNLVIHPHKK